VGFGQGGWGTAPQPPIPNPQSPIPNPQSPKKLKLIIIFLNFINNILYKYSYNNIIKFQNIELL